MVSPILLNVNKRSKSMFEAKNVLFFLLPCGFFAFFVEGKQKPHL
ncbi:hypothetical protein AsAng_0024070 [Aureispira anguillae]|uniref:Uncharacterized protein n=1 Tax=Aureispira anguillae TaxID=2864201 RepID=A0A915YEK8_9BACT|nr:hypothetical protein AsAng_0024070 [Aureispira anguillae]